MAAVASVGGGMTDTTRARAIAFYLPQFHPVPENDEWWGPGFTEWSALGRARPLYRGHEQPKLPGSLGFYDLRLPETRAAQAELARAHGFTAFCYWHYWFGAGRRMLERPFDEVLASGEPDFPFCLGWANENWTSIWVGDRHRTLVEQTYPEGDLERHFRAVAPAFADDRYLTVDGRPLFYVHRPDLLPDAGRFVDTWRDLADREGFPGIYLVGESKRGWDVAGAGFDAYVQTPLLGIDRRPRSAKLWTRLRREARRGPFVHPYTAVNGNLRRAQLPQPELPMVLSCWDNTPRHGRNGFVLDGATPARFGAEMAAAVDAVGDMPSDERLVFVKSWNEWAEGNYIEPDRRWGTAFLEAARDALATRIPAAAP